MISLIQRICLKMNRINSDDMTLTVGEIILIKKAVKEIFTLSHEIEEITIKQKFAYYLDLDDVDGRIDTDLYTNIKIIKKDDENYIIERTLKEQVIKRLYNIHSSVLEKI